MLLLVKVGVLTYNLIVKNRKLLTDGEVTEI